jgi:hypothetical protein
MPSKNEIAATMTRGEAARSGVIDAGQAGEAFTTNSRRMYGFTRKMVPSDFPVDPKIYIFSISEYGEKVNLGPGFPGFEVFACPEGSAYGPPCVISPFNFFEEAKVDVTEHTFTSGKQIADAILKVGPGMNAGMDKRRLGWFTSNTNPPTAEEVAHANELYTSECKRLFTEANRYASANQLNEINETHRRAARYLGQTVTWDKPQEKMIDCPGCKEKVRDGAAVHATPYCGYVFNWFTAIDNGLRSFAQAPPDVQRAYKKLKEDEKLA